MSLTAAEIKAVLETPEKILSFTDKQVEAAVQTVLGFYGRAANAGLLNNVVPIYRHWITRTHVAQRHRVYQQMADLVIAREFEAPALVPFVSCEPDRFIVSLAALDYSLLAPSGKEDQTSAAREIIALWRTGEILNGAGALGGLLMTGDRRFINLVMAPCRALSCEEIEQLVTLRCNFLSVDLVEFYLAWLESLDSITDAEVYGTVAAGLTNLVTAAQDGQVYELERIVPATTDANIRILGQKGLAEFANAIAPRLQKIARSEKGEPIMPEVLAAWGLGLY